VTKRKTKRGFKTKESGTCKRCGKRRTPLIRFKDEYICDDCLVAYPADEDRLETTVRNLYRSSASSWVDAEVHRP